MSRYTAKEIKELKRNPYTYKVTSNKLYFAVQFKKDFWMRYQAGDAPRKIIGDFGYDVGLFHQKQIDNIVQRVKKEALSGDGFNEGENRTKRLAKKAQPEEILEESPTVTQMQHELMYLRQEVEFLKKIIKADNQKRKN